MYNRVVIAPGTATYLGSPEGGTLLGIQSGPGSITFQQMQWRVWSMLNEPGPDTGYPAGTSADFPVTMVQRDLNIAMGDFLGETGVSQGLTEKWQSTPVFPLLDFPIPLDCSSLMRVEYTPQGQQTQKLIGLSQEEFDSITGDLLPNSSGQPYYYRAPFAGYIRLMPQPTFGNYVGALGGSFTLAGNPTVGDQLTATFTYAPAGSVTTAAYTVQPGDNLATIAFQLSQVINGCAAVIGTGPGEPFLAQCNPNAQVVTIVQAPGIPYNAVIDYIGATTSTTMTITPFSSVLQMVPIGDVMTFYYSSLGNVMVNTGDTPPFPPQFHMAVVYRVLADYWEIKKDGAQSQRYLAKYKQMIKDAKAWKFDKDLSTQFTVSGDDDTADWAGLRPW